MMTDSPSEVFLSKESALVTDQMARRRATRRAPERSQLLAEFQIVLFFLVFSFLIPRVSAAMQPKDLQEHSQPDGTTIVLVLMQSGSQNWFTDEVGYSVVRTADRYEYAASDEDGGLKGTEVPVGSVDPRKSALPTRVRPSPEFLLQQRAEAPTGSPPPSPHPVEVQQPDGTTIKLNLCGGGHYSWYEDEFGYTAVRVPGRYEYALRGPEGHLVGSGIMVGSMSPAEAGFQRGIQPARVNK